MKTSSVLPIISPRNKGYTTPKALTSRGERSKLPPLSEGSSFPLKTLDRHIKNNDVIQILKDNRQPVVYERNSDDILKDEVRETSANLLYLRKKYDELRENCNKKEQDMNKLRMEVDKLRSKEDQFSMDNYNAHHKSDQLNEALAMQRLKIEEAVENNHTYGHMLDRLKKDKLTDKMKSSHLEDILHGELAKLTSEAQHAQKAAQFSIQTRVVFEGIMKQVESEDKKRQHSLFVFEKTLSAQEEADLKRTERMQRNQTVAETALNDLKDSNEHQWRELQLVHKFLNFFLKRKTEREIRQYETVEKAYQIIKASTGLGDTREIVSKFVNREQTYSELLISIADYEKKISDLRKVNEQRNAQIQVLKDQTPERVRDEKTENQSTLVESYKQLEVVGEKSKQAKLMVEKTYGWTMQALIKLDKAKKNLNNKHHEQNSKEKLSEAFLKLIETVKTDLAAIKEQEVEKVLDEIDKTRVDEVVRNEDFIARNMRVKPIMSKLERMKSVESPLHSKRSMLPDETEHHVEVEGEEDGTDDHENLEPHPRRSNTRKKTFEPVSK